MKSATGQLRLELEKGPWTVAKDADPDCRAIQRRHYSRRVYRDGRDPAKFLGPGSYIVLVTARLNALFAWRKFIDDAIPHQWGLNCAIFRNEGPELSSSLILAAEPFAWEKWPDQARLYTYVDRTKIRSTNPGYCFLRAGWRKAGTTKTGKMILEKIRKM